MLTRKLVLATSLALITTGALADSGDLHISDWDNQNFSVTREQVKQEMREAYAHGNISVGEAGYLIAETPSTRSRAEVVAELREAERLGVLPSVGEGDTPIATPEQEKMIAKAGKDAAERFAKSGDVEG